MTKAIPKSPGDPKTIATYSPAGAAAALGHGFPSQAGTEGVLSHLRRGPRWLRYARERSVSVLLGVALTPSAVSSLAQADSAAPTARVSGLGSHALPATSVRAAPGPAAAVVPLRHQAPISTQNFDRKDVRLVDPAATPETVSLFAYLKNVAKTHMLFGHQLTTAQGFSVTKKDGSESDVLRAVGSFPAVYGWDTLSITGQGESGFDVARHMRAAYDRGGINTLSAHMFNFVSGGNFWDTTQVVAHILPGGSHHRAFTSYLDKVADFANTLRDAQGRPIPIVFRPFHENTGNWFWWGASHCTVEEYRLLFRFTVEYLRDVKRVHSFLYAYSPATHFATDKEYLGRYPGDAYVDLLGVDGYDNDLTGGWMKAMLRDLAIAGRLAAKKGKVAIVAETGATSNGLKRENNPNKEWYSKRWLGAIEDSPAARQFAYMLVWRNGSVDHFWVPYRDHPTLGNHEMLDDFVRFYNDESTVFGDQLEGVYSLGVKALPAPPVTYLAFPLSGQKVSGEYDVRLKADGHGRSVEKVVLAIPGARELEMSLRNGYYVARWDFAEAPLGKPFTFTARARYAGGIVQTADATVKPSARNLARLTFTKDLEGMEYDGDYAAAGSARATIRRSDAVGGGALVIDANLRDDGTRNNWTYQELRVKVSELRRRVDLRHANRARFELLIPAAETARFFVEPGLRFYFGGGRHVDFGGRGLFVTDLPTVTLEGTRYYRYEADIELSEVAKADSVAVQFIAKDASYQGPIYLDNLKFIEALVDAPPDPGLVDDFELYGGSSAAVSEKYARNAGGNSIRLSLQKRGKGYGLRYHYGMGSPSYAGMTRVLSNADWREYCQLEFWFKPDARKQNLVIQIQAGGKTYESWLRIAGLAEGLVRVPFSALRSPNWAPDAGAGLELGSLKAVSAFSIFINADSGSTPTPFESDLYFDDIRATRCTPH